MSRFDRHQAHTGSPGTTRDDGERLSLLYPGPVDATRHAEPPSTECLHDLALDRILEGTASDEATRAVLVAPLRDAAAIRYRQAIMRDLEDASLRSAAAGFRTGVRVAAGRADADEPAGFPYARERAHLDAAVRYVEAVSGLAQAMADVALASNGLRALRAHLARVDASEPFRSLVEDTRRVGDALADVRYQLLIEGRSVSVRPDRASDDVGEAIEALFGGFMTFPAGEVDAGAYLPGERNSVQAAVLKRLAALHPEPFRDLAAFAGRHRSFPDPALARVAREIGFYLDYLAYLDPLREAGLPFCYPRVDDEVGATRCRDAFDLALARRLASEGRAVVLNDVALDRAERILVVTGPNQGGKTTFARTIGQLHYLASLGCAVPGSEARVGLYDRLHTHFERSERATERRGELGEDLARMRAILETATPASIVILNETFSSTTLADARFLGSELLRRLSALDLRAVYVTFVDELAGFDAKTVSVVAALAPDDPAVRTFKLVRRPADGAAHALAIARKHGVTYEQILERMPE